jgi:hypothetical protein
LAVYKTSSFVFLSFFMLSTSATWSYIIKRDQQSAGFALPWQTCDCLKLLIVCWCFTNVVNLVVRKGKMMQDDAWWWDMVRWCEMARHWGTTVSQLSIPKAWHKSLRRWARTSRSSSAGRWSQQRLAARNLGGKRHSMFFWSFVRPKFPAEKS